MLLLVFFWRMPQVEAASQKAKPETSERRFLGEEGGSEEGTSHLKFPAAISVGLLVPEDENRI